MNWTAIAIDALRVGIIFFLLVNAIAVLTFVERRFAGIVQYRIGPNRVGPFGLFQPLADGIKFIFKESPIPEGAHPYLFRVAPLFAAVPAMLTFAVIPIGNKITIFGHSVDLVGANIEVGALYVLAISSLSVYGIILGGWAAKSKYSLLGGLRSSAQVISYELGMVLAVVAVLISSESLNLFQIVEAQSGLWNIVPHFVGFIVFLVASFAETNRHPFDFAECESELVAGFHTEYASMRFALYFLGEYAAMITMSAMMTTLYLGGPMVPGVNFETMPWWLGLLSFLAKTGFFIFIFMLVRWSFPRLRYDQLMSLGWKVMLPLSLLNLIWIGIYEVLL